VAEHDDRKTRHLICVKCKTESDDAARGWRALRGDNDEVVTYCPSCAMRVFGAK